MLSLLFSTRLKEVKYISLGHRANRGRGRILIQVCVTSKAFHLTTRLESLPIIAYFHAYSKPTNLEDS